MISRIIEVEVGVISRSRSHFFYFFANAKKHKAGKLDMITIRNHAPRSCMTWLPVTLTWLLVTLTWLLYNLQLWRHGRWFRKFTVRFRPIRKEIASSMYNNRSYITPRDSNSWRICSFKILDSFLSSHSWPLPVSQCYSLRKLKNWERFYFPRWRWQKLTWPRNTHRVLFVTYSEKPLAKRTG